MFEFSYVNKCTVKCYFWSTILKKIYFTKFQNLAKIFFIVQIHGNSVMQDLTLVTQQKKNIGKIISS